MMKHQPDLTRPMTEIERVIREIRPLPPDELPQPIQVPGFRDSHDPRIPESLRLAAIRRAQRVPTQKGKRK
jgi:hypothetical protein